MIIFTFPPHLGWEEFGTLQSGDVASSSIQQRLQQLLLPLELLYLLGPSRSGAWLETAPLTHQYHGVLTCRITSSGSETVGFFLLAVHANPPWCSQARMHLRSVAQSRIRAK